MIGHRIPSADFVLLFFYFGDANLLNKKTNIWRQYSSKPTRTQTHTHIDRTRSATTTAPHRSVFRTVYLRFDII